MSPAIDAVKIDDRFRLCYGDTEDIALVGDDPPIMADIWDTEIVVEAALKGRRVWILVRKPQNASLGYSTKGAALRALDMMILNGIIILENPNVSSSEQERDVHAIGDSGIKHIEDEAHDSE